jgi:hypothetical protein
MLFLSLSEKHYLMANYNYDEESVKSIIKWAETAQLPKEIILSEAERITDPKIYVQTNIYDIKEHYPDPFFNPAIDRLYRLKEFVEGA